VKKVIIRKHTLLDIILIKYKKTHIKSKINTKLKHMVKVIYHFHNKNKTIWFVGFNSLRFLNNTRLNSKHVFLSDNYWKQDLIKNKKFFKQKKIFKNLQVPNLIVIFNDNSKKIDIINELGKINIPIIIFDSFYKVPEKFTYVKIVSIKDYTKKIKSFLFYLIYSILKKS